MNKTTKIALWSVGGLAVATGLFFAIRALLPKKNEEDMTPKEEDLYARLLDKELRGELSDKERELLENLRNKTEKPGPDEMGGGKCCPDRFQNNSKGICVAKMQLAINEKHDNSWSGDGVGGEIDYPCEKSGSALAVDGDMGPKTMLAINKFYPSDRLCVRKNVFACHCTGSISKSTYNSIISGADTSNAALEAAGYAFRPGEKACNEKSSSFSGYSNMRGAGCEGGVACNTCDTCGGGCKYADCRNGCCMQKMTDSRVGRDISRNYSGDVSSRKKCRKCCNPNDGAPYSLPTNAKPCRCPKSAPEVSCKDAVKVTGPQYSFGGTQYSNFTLSNKTQLRGEGAMEWRTMEGVMGDFYPNSYGFIDEPVVDSGLRHSYGMRNFGGDVSINLPKLDLYGRKL